MLPDLSWLMWLAWGIGGALIEEHTVFGECF